MSPGVRNCYIAGWEATLLKHGVSSPRGIKEHAFATVVKAFISWYYKFIVSLLLVDCLRGLACSPTSTSERLWTGRGGNGLKSVGTPPRFHLKRTEAADQGKFCSPRMDTVVGNRRRAKSPNNEANGL